MPPNPEISTRTSSNKRRASTSIEEQAAKIKKLEMRIKIEKLDLKPHESLDSSYWRARARVSKLLQEKDALKKKQSIQNFEFKHVDREAKTQAWLETAEGQEIVQTMRANELDYKMCERQARRLHNRLPNDNDDEKVNADFFEKNRRRAFMKLFTSSFRGLGIKSQQTGGERDPDIQQMFRECLIRAQESRHPNHPVNTTLWCPIIDSYVMPSATKAAHIFPSCNGQEMMTEIFGRDAGLYSIWNGIMMSHEAEVHFDKGHFVIVPDVEPSDSIAELSRWNHHDEPQNYKIRIFNPQGRDMDTLVNGEGSVTWCELDGKRVSFRGKARPKARYLYYHYCVTMLRKSWNGDKKAGVLNDELGKPFWATSGPYLRKRMLTALVEEMGHEYDALLAGAMEDDNDTLLRAATQHIQNSNGGGDEMSKAVKHRDEGDSETDEEGSSDE
ncbi:MAG: hypothetical protein LQ349_007672 [Xanthoria aureola]|nr:MAG: hypothetical protein LQ349_007672 [Xanthoria aureola]